MKLTPPAPCSGASPCVALQDGLQARAERFLAVYEAEAAGRGLPLLGQPPAGTSSGPRRGHLRPAGGRRSS